MILGNIFFVVFGVNLRFTTVKRYCRSFILSFQPFVCSFETVDLIIQLIKVVFLFRRKMFQIRPYGVAK